MGAHSMISVFIQTSGKQTSFARSLKLMDISVMELIDFNMQVFIIGSPIDTAEVLDKRRLNKQIIECRQILAAIDGTSKAWANHPCVLMYREHRSWLNNYLYCLELAMHGHSAASFYSQRADKIRPPFHTSEYFDQMKRRLYTKDKGHYKQWSSLGESQVNWYYVLGNWRYYRNGKRIASASEG